MDSINTTLKYMKYPEFLVISGVLTVLGLLLVVVTFFGEKTDYHKNMIKPCINVWLIRGLWVLSAISSFVSFYYLSKELSFPQYLFINTLFIITAFLFLVFGLFFFHTEYINISLWISIIIFIYNIWIYKYVNYFSPTASIFLIPNLILYVYMIFSTSYCMYKNQKI